MSPVTLALALVVLLASASLGVVAHELAHAFVLRACGVSYRLEWLPEAAGSPARAAAVGAFARVTPVDLSPEVPAWHLRIAAMAPLVLALPFALAAVGAVSVPAGAGHRFLTIATVGLLACAVPSPADFSLFFHTERAIESAADEESEPA